MIIDLISIPNSKAQTLNYLKNTLKTAVILDLYIFTVEKWTYFKEECIKEISFLFSKQACFIVRSSSMKEDQLSKSSAGMFHSVLNVEADSLERSIDAVIRSYGENVSMSDEVLIQPMLKNVTISGVLFSKDPKHGGNYYVINYDKTGDTSAITSGKSLSTETLIIAKSFKKIEDPKIKKLVELAEELEQKIGYDNLDVEFAFDTNNQLYLFQVRPLIISHAVQKIDQSKILEQIKNKFQLLNTEHPYMCGKRTILAIMPDWNPAEMIGLRPKPLALSLYRELITDSTWAYQRDSYGYKNLRSSPLMIDLMGLPYIDVRVSFNSFIPKELDDRIANKLVNYYLYRLEKEPFLHDKVEFDIVFSCYTFDLLERIQILKNYEFNEGEIKSVQQALRILTNNIIHNNRGLWIQDIDKIEELKKRHDAIFLNREFDDFTKIYWLIEYCKRYGTLPFAGLARAGFIAIQLLNSMVNMQVLTDKERMLFLNSLNSVSSNISKDICVMDRVHFLNRYGHLRPGTYDILSPRYDENPDLYFNWDKIKNDSIDSKEEFKLTLSQMKKIEVLLKEHGLEHDVLGLFTFIKSAIEGREYSKFVFTKTVSDVLSLLKKISQKYKFSLDDMAYVDIQKILKLYATSWNMQEELQTMMILGKQKYEITKQINLPPVILNQKDLEYFYLPEYKPNFITMKSVTAPIVIDLKNDISLENKIVFIPSADPGFDWIFTRGISGFVTAYGGVNSHMAIRAGELNLPAVIGAGEKLYDIWKKANILHIDCLNHKVEVLH